VSLSITDEMKGPAVVVRLVGQLDTLTAKPFESHLAALISQGQKRIIVDLEGVNYVSSYGLRVFLLTAKQLRSDRRAFTLCRLTLDVKKIFRISGFDKILTIHDTLEEAISLAAE
jgi:stage II sporulation protein AA (anti-sigma F factor antagonist)